MLVVVAAQRVELVQQRGVAAVSLAAVCICGDLYVEGAGREFVFDFTEAGEGLHHLVVDGAIRGLRGPLRHVAKPNAALPSDSACVGFEFAGQDANQRGLARAVWPDNADAVALVD